MTKRIIAIIFLTLAFSVAAFAQRTISGRVTDSTGEGVPGAGVMVQGTSRGAVTDLDGKWSLNVKGGEVTLEISCLGYTSTTVTVAADRTKVDVVLQDDTQMLEETVVVGYGTQKKVNLRRHRGEGR